MENKYYTPDISEFHVGFEFEAKVYVARSAKEEDISWSWEKCKLGEPDKFSSLVSNSMIDDGMLESESIRVKHLDTEDIESLYPIEEWFVSDNMYGGTWMIKYHGFGKISVVTKDFVRDASGEFSVLTILHRARIKNKSEFKRILKQIGV